MVQQSKLLKHVPGSISDSTVGHQGKRPGRRRRRRRRRKTRKRSREDPL